MNNEATVETTQLPLTLENVPTFVKHLGQGGSAAHPAKSRFTVVSKKTGQRFTFQVQKPKVSDDETVGVDRRPMFVKVLTGSDNETDYSFLGTVFQDGTFVVSKKSKMSSEAPSAKAFAWFWSCARANSFTSFELYHEGCCARCGRTLTVPESIQTGLGPECAQKGM